MPSFFRQAGSFVSPANAGFDPFGMTDPTVKWGHKKWGQACDIDDSCVSGLSYLTRWQGGERTPCRSGKRNTGPGPDEEQV